MAVSLYTSRGLLRIVGIEDYGIYSIVGGVVALFGFLNAAMASSTQRFLSFDIGRGDQQRLRNTFSAALFIHIAIALLTLILAETIGIWYISNKINVPFERITILKGVYHFSVLTFLIGFVQAPFNALVIAREKMDVFAVISLVDAVLKLAAIFLLESIRGWDNLLLYAILLFFVSILTCSFTFFYCRKNFEETKLRFFHDKKDYLILITYSGWNLLGNIAVVAKSQGLNMVLNGFFGVLINAAYGIMLQVQAAINTFIYSFQLAVAPQIIKKYSVDKQEEALAIISRSSKVSFFLTLLIVVPIIYNTETILELWIGEVPAYSSIFVKLCLLTILIDSLSGPIMTGIQASGRIKWYQIVVSFLVFLNVPISYILLKVSNNPADVLTSSIFISLLTFHFRLYYLKKSFSFSIRWFYVYVIFRVFIVSSALVLFLYFWGIYGDCGKGSFWGIVGDSILISFFGMITIFFIGLNDIEKRQLYQFALEKFRKDSRK